MMALMNKHPWDVRLSWLENAFLPSLFSGWFWPAK